MIHAYNESSLPIVRNRLATMFEIAVYYEKMDIDDFANMFTSSFLCKEFETADYIYVFGKSSSELLGLLLNKEPKELDLNVPASPEYWVGWILAYAQWYLNKPYKELIQACPCSELINNYFPYHEMDIKRSLELFIPKLNMRCPLKEFRKSNNLSQEDLAILSDVPLRTIKAYEQGTNDIAKAQAETLYKLSHVLNCTIEDLIIL